MTYIYKLTRNDDLEYIGITNDLKRRLGQHKRSKRFEDGIMKIEILFEGSYIECENAEETYITLHDTYNNGLNITKHGKGNHHDSSRFNTLGYKFSDESKEKMSKAKEGFVPWNKGKKGCWKPDKDWIDKHTYNGSTNPKAILNEDIVRNIIKEYLSRPTIENVGIIQGNGKPMSYVWAFCLKKSTEYEITPQAIRRLLEKKSWKNVWKEYEV